MLCEMRLLSKSFAAFAAWIRPRLYVDAAVLKQSALLFEFFLAYGTPHIQRHTGRPPVLYQVRQHFTLSTKYPVSNT